MKIKKLKYLIIVNALTVIFIEMFIAGNSFAANYPLTIIQPVAGRSTANRFYLAYPNLDYNVRMGVTGGTYPFTYSLTSSPSGMTINSSTGVIDWPTPTTSGSPFTVTAKVLDSAGSSQTVSWTLTVQTSNFIFVDSVNGHHSVCNDTNPGTATGSIGNPFLGIQDWYCGTDYASKSNTTYQNYFVYYRAGTYQMDGYFDPGTCYMSLALGAKPVVHMAYPGESVTWDMTTVPMWIDSQPYDIWFSGITLINMGMNQAGACAGNSYGIRLYPLNGNVVIYNMIFHDNATVMGHNNQSAIMFIRNPSSNVTNISIQNNTFYNMTHAYGILFYTINGALVEDNTFHDFADAGGETDSHGIGLKEATNYFFVRHNNFYNFANSIVAIWFYNSPCQQGGCNGFTYSGHGEINFNNAIVGSSQAPLDMNGFGSNGYEVYVYRNTFSGSGSSAGQDLCACNVTSGVGPYYFNNNVIVNSNAGYTNHIDNSMPLGGTFYPANLVETNNLVGVPGDNIIDANGNLTSSYFSNLGKMGYQINGSMPSPPTNMTVK